MYGRSNNPIVSALVELAPRNDDHLEESLRSR